MKQTGLLENKYIFYYLGFYYPLLLMHKKLYKVWIIESSWVFDDTLFRNTQYMRGWTWQNFYNNYMNAVKYGSIRWSNITNLRRKNYETY